MVKVGSLHIFHGLIFNLIKDDNHKLLFSCLDESFLNSDAIHLNHCCFPKISEGIQEVSKFYKQLQQRFIAKLDFALSSILFHISLDCF